MSQQAIDRLNRLAQLLDSARERARADVAELMSLLSEASVTLESVGTAIREAAATRPPDPAVVAAAMRARASHAALHRVLEEQLAMLGRQVAHAESVTAGAVSYTAPSPTGHRLDRLG